MAGGDQIVISGANLGNGTDIVTVLLAGVPATIISQNTTAVIVRAGPVPTNITVAPNGTVVIRSLSRGESLSTVQFAYRNDGPFVVNHLASTCPNGQYVRTTARPTRRQRARVAVEPSGMSWLVVAKASLAPTARAGSPA